MKTTKEAADMLGISPRRVTALIESGLLDAEKVGTIWLIDEHSIAKRNATVNKAGGRPAAYRGPRISRYMLMSRTHEVAEVAYDASTNEFTWVGPIIDADRAPIGLVSNHHSIAPTTFNDWWRNRGIPEGRFNIEQILHEQEVEIPSELAVRSLGLSLSDQYWIAPEHATITWHDVNFFHNDFPHATLVDGNRGLFHPDNTSDGNLPKHWVVRNNTRVLLKGGSTLRQEPFNEAVATALHQRLLEHGEFVPYWLDALDGRPASACACFLTDEEEYVPAVYVERVLQRQPHHNAYQHYVECCERLGVPHVEDSLAHMIVCDDIMANSDRHARNYGIIRNVETLACRCAPLFDSGTSLWCHKDAYDVQCGNHDFTCKQFKSSPARQLLLANDLSWVDTTALDGFVDEAMEILRRNEFLADRLAYIEQGLAERVDRMVRICEALG